MTTTPKGYTELTNASSMSGPEQINDAERFVEDLIGESKPTAANLPTSGNWIGRTITAADTGALYLWGASGWVRVWASGSTPYAMAAGVGSIAFTGASQTFSIALPAGRFTQAPIITIMTRNNTYGTTFSGIATSTTNVDVFGSSGQAGLTVPYQWIAVQMVA